MNYKSYFNSVQPEDSLVKQTRDIMRLYAEGYFKHRTFAQEVEALINNPRVNNISQIVPALIHLSNSNKRKANGDFEHMLAAIYLLLRQYGFPFAEPLGKVKVSLMPEVGPVTLCELIDSDSQDLPKARHEIYYLRAITAADNLDQQIIQVLEEYVNGGVNLGFFSSRHHRSAVKNLLTDYKLNKMTRDKVIGELLKIAETAKQTGDFKNALTAIYYLLPEDDAIKFAFANFEVDLGQGPQKLFKPNLGNNNAHGRESSTGTGGLRELRILSPDNSNDNQTSVKQASTTSLDAFQLSGAGSASIWEVRGHAKVVIPAPLPKLAITQVAGIATTEGSPRSTATCDFVSPCSSPGREVAGDVAMAAVGPGVGAQVASGLFAQAQNQAVGSLQAQLSGFFKRAADLLLFSEDLATVKKLAKDLLDAREVYAAYPEEWLTRACSVLTVIELYNKEMLKDEVVSAFKAEVMRRNNERHPNARLPMTVCI